MIVIPAVDIKNGKCVRLLQGRQDSETVFSDDPAAMAERWAQAGAEIIHVVDLDGAFQKSPQNLPIIQKIVEEIGADVQIGGGIRNEDTVASYLGMGVSRVIIGTEAIRNPQFVTSCCRHYPGRIVVGIDAKQGRVAIEGWTHTTDIRALDLAKRFDDAGVAAINFTDIHRDGTQTGPNIYQTRQVAEAVSVPVIASGGVSVLEDIKNLMPLEAVGVAGVITGKALYTGSLDLKAAITLARSAAT